MADPLHPTSPVWELFDPMLVPPPKGGSLLLVNAGGVLITGPWHEGALAWGYKPTMRKSIGQELVLSSVKSAPQGVSLILINEGGALILGQWYDGALAWGFKPTIPATVKERIRVQLEQQCIRSANLSRS